MNECESVISECGVNINTILIINIRFKKRAIKRWKKPETRLKEQKDKDKDKDGISLTRNMIAL